MGKYLPKVIDFFKINYFCSLYNPTLSKNQILGNISDINGIFQITIMVFEEIEDSLETYKKLNKFNINFPKYKLFIEHIINLNN